MRIPAVHAIVLIPLLVTPVLAGDEEPPATPPQYSFLRPNEDWGDFESSGIWSTKHFDLNDDGSIWASFGARMESRFESWNDFGFGPANNDDFLLWRTLAHLDVHVGDSFRVFTELKSALVTDRNLPGGRRTLDRDVFALQQLFFDATVPLVGDATLTVRPGRQSLLFGAQRIISPLPWGNTLRTWDGVTAKYRSGPWKVSGLFTAFAPVDQEKFNETDEDQLLYGLYANHTAPETKAQTEVYWIGNTRAPNAMNPNIGDAQRQTFGGRRKESLGAFDYEVEGGVQVGEVGSREVLAGFGAAQLGWKPAGRDGGTRVFVGGDWGSGDSSPGGSVNTFDQLYPLGHAYLGFADIIARQNVVAASLGASQKVWKGATIGVTGLSFWLDDRSDALYAVNGAVGRGAPAGGFNRSHVGYEADVLLRQRVGRHAGFYVGYSHVFSGSVIRSSGPADDIDFFYVGASLTW